MEPVSDPVVREEPQSSKRRPHSERSAINTVFGFPVVQNQFQSLQSVEFQSPGQREEGLVDPRSTRHLRQAAEDQGTENAGNTSFAVHVENPAQDIFANGTCVEPVAMGNSQFFQNSFSASSSDILYQQSVEPVQYSLGTGISGGDAMYNMYVKDVACTESSCNKRISYAGPEWSAGRPGHTPSRRILACGKLIEDSYAGQDWSAG